MKRILTILLTALSLTALAQTVPFPPSGSVNNGSTNYRAPNKMLYFGTNPLGYLGVYPAYKIDSLLAALPIFDASLYYTKVASDARFYPLSTNPAGYLTSFTEVDPTVPVYAKSLTAFSVIKTSTDALYPTLIGTGASGTWNINVLGNASTVTNGVYTAGSYANPSWITSLAYSKLTGAPDLSGYELLANKQNSLTTDGTGVKYPTVDAVNTGLGTKQNSISLTTTGTSGAATLIGSTLNIPNYAPGTGTVTSVTSADANISVATGTTTPVLTLAANISSNAATATLAANSTQWDGRNWAGAQSSTNSYFMTSPDAGNWNYSTNEQARIQLGIPSGGETLQSVTDRGATTTNTISADTFRGSIKHLNPNSGFDVTLAYDDDLDRLALTSSNLSDASLYVQGNVITPTVIISNAPTLGDHATNKTYVDGLDVGNVKITGSQTIIGQKQFEDIIVAKSGLYSYSGIAELSASTSSVYVIDGTNRGSSLNNDGSLQLTSSGGRSELRSTNVVGVKLVEFPNASGTIALTSQFASGSGNASIAGFTTNITTSTALEETWIRITDPTTNTSIVTVHGCMLVTPTATGAIEIAVNPPVSTLFTNEDNMSGTVGSTAISNGIVSASTLNDNVRIQATATSSGSSITLSYTYSYKIR